MDSNNKNKKRYLIPSIISLALLLAASIGMLCLYRPTRYLPFYQLGLAILMPSLIDLSLLLLKIPVRGGKKHEPDNAEAENASEMPKPKRIWARLSRTFVRFLRRIGNAVNASKLIGYFSFAFAAVSFAVVQYLFARSLRAATSLYTVSYAYAVLLIVLFLALIVLDKWILHNEDADEYATALGFNVRSVLAVARLALILIIPSIFFKLLGFLELQKYIVAAMAVIFYWSSLFTLISYLARAIRRELEAAPDIRIPTLFSGGSGRDMGIISYLEENTGITMRGLWSVKLIKRLIVPSLIAAFTILWISTGIIEIDSGQRGAVYSFGRLCDEPLEPGLHMTLPWPFGKTMIYNTDAVSSMTIGYRSDTSGDNIWTQSHGSDEYELLLGGGEELVSINLCIEYKIRDLNAYLINCADPEAILEASAYELVADKTIDTDLNTLLSVDREQFATDFMADLTEIIGIRTTGLEVVSVVLESIHPPLGIADVYQQLVSAEIEASTGIMYANAAAAVRILEAESTYNSMVSYAKAEQYRKTAEAEAEVAEFMASVAADSEYKNAYRYYKYMNAVKNAFGNANIIIVDPDIDQSRIYFGSIKN